MLYWCVGKLLQVFNSDDGFSLYDVITIEEAVLSYQTDPIIVVLGSEKGLLHILLGQTAATQVYGLIYSASRIENTDGMRFSVRSFCMLMCMALLVPICDRPR